MNVSLSGLFLLASDNASDNIGHRQVDERQHASSFPLARLPRDQCPREGSPKDRLTAFNGELTDALSRRDDIHVPFTDVVMPRGIDGIQLARSTRDLRPEVRIVLASGYPIPALRAQYGHLDDSAFTHKPYRLADLARMLGMAT
ncbi:hypothetical protein [Paraburkholderia kirstenboschensis]|uniref:Response regulatory domain-containing protein n=1 Tax=Paraburkholderia kirstenboschensis TaxID=1245436 RepID=A0ABZ0EC84_9BURK|nr:hypothetical protein [Paraburkholderia kirstenboschensis]WOD14838.1 hypothetical protein RW095_15910 [Paraburkholderia kirstenboschensis]